MSKRSLRPRKPRPNSESEDFEEKLFDKKKEKQGLRKRTPKRSRNPESDSVSSEGRNQLDVASKLESDEQEAWTDKYKPSRTHPFIGSASTISELRSWLLRWKEKNMQTSRSKPHDLLSDSEDSTECVSNCFLLTGPPGVGKTSSVYYLAEELGFKVLEVHASSERAGRRILSQLQEATQSHHVEGSKLPFLFQSYSAVVQHKLTSPVQERTPKLKKVGPLQKLFEQQTSSTKQPKKKFTECVPKRNSKSTLEGYFVLAAEGSTAKADALKHSSTKTTLLDYFGGAPAEAKASEPPRISLRTQGRRKQKFSLKSSQKPDKKTKLPSEGDDDVEIIPVEIEGEVTACKLSKSEPILAKRAVAKRSLNKNLSLVAVIKGDAPENLKKGENGHDCTVKKRMKATPRSPIKRCRRMSDTTLTETDPKSSLTFSSLTIILFDDVDTIFQQDDGFWSAVDSVLSTTKKPVVFTATRDIWLVRAKLPSHCPVAEFFSPTCAEVVTLMKNVCSLEGVQVPSDEQLLFMSQYYHCDVRRCLSELQLQTLPISRALDSVSDSKPLGLCLTHLPLREESSRVLQCGKSADTLAVQLIYKELGLDLVYLSLTDLLPFPIMEEEQKSPTSVNISRKQESQNPFDVSWLSDSDDAEKQSVIETGVIAKRQHPHGCTLKGCLYELALLFDDFSMVDYFSARYSKCFGCTARSLPSSRIDAWQAGRADWLHRDDEACLSMCAYTASDTLNYFEVSSVKLRACRLQGLMANAGEELSEASYVTSSYIPSLYNFYDIAASSGSSKRIRRQLAECAVPASVVLNSVALSDYMNCLTKICTSEKQRKDWNTKRSQRFLHYLNSCSLFLTEDLVTFLCKRLST